MLGIIAAMDVEIKSILENMKEVHLVKINDITFYQGLLTEKKVVCAKTDPGKVNAAICAQTMYLKFKPQAILSAGVSGGIEGMKILDIVVADSFVQHDMDTSAIGDPLGFISGIEKIILPADEKLKTAIYEAAKEECRQNKKEEKEDSAIWVGRIATGDQFIQSSEKKLEIKNQFDAISYEMECGAIAQVCYKGSIPYGAVRVISDHADENSPTSYQEYLEKAARLSGKIICRAVSKITFI